MGVVEQQSGVVKDMYFKEESRIAVWKVSEAVRPVKGWWDDGDRRPTPFPEVLPESCIVFSLWK